MLPPPTVRGERGKDEAVAARAKAKADGVRTDEERRGAASERPRTAQKKQRSALPRFTIILH